MASVLNATWWAFLCVSTATAQVDLRVDVNLVVLHVTMGDHSGKVISSLPEEKVSRIRGRRPPRD